MEMNKGAAGGACRWIPEPDCAINRCRGKELAVGRRTDSMRMTFESAAQASCRWILELDCAVKRCRGRSWPSGENATA